MNQKYNIISIALLFLCACGSEPQTKVKQIPKKTKVKIEVPNFNEDSAYYYIQKQVDFGPRVISSKPWENCAFWLEQKFLQYTEDVIVQEAPTTTYDGKKHILKNIIAVLDWQMNINDAVASPNFAKMYNVLELEENSKITQAYEALHKRGNELKIRDLTSGVNAIHVKDGKYHAGVDPRREGMAKGL